MTAHDRPLTRDLAKAKCRLGSGDATCSFLAANAGGFICAFVNVGLREAIIARRVAETMRARGGPCAYPLDDTSIAAEPPPVPAR
jgi:hypothetical protein